MGQRQLPYQPPSPEQHTILAGLNAQISNLDTQIAALLSSKNVLEQAHDYILSTSTNNAQHTNGLASPSSGSPMAQQYSLPFVPTKKSPSSLRQQAIIRNALEKDRSPTPQAGSGLLSSDEFEAAFGGGEDERDGRVDGNGDVRMSVEEESTTTTTRSTRSMTSTSAESPASETDTSSGNGQGAHWEAKRATKRKLQENAAKAREARRRKLDESGRRTV
jgi:hypothetical protein